VQVENYGYAEICLNIGNEEIYAEEENLQYNGDHPTRGRDWLTYSVFLTVLARRTRREGDILKLVVHDSYKWYILAWKVKILP
jgi:hypothetical protein